MNRANETEPPELEAPVQELQDPAAGMSMLTPPESPPPASESPRELPVLPVPERETIGTQASNGGVILILVLVALSLIAASGWYIFFVW